MKNKNVVHLDEYVYQQVFDAILEQRLAPLTKLNEAELAQIFSVSRTVIRRALVRLSHDGVVESRKNKGTTLASVTPQQARSIFEARRVTEAAIVRLACAKITDRDVEGLNDLIDAEHSAQVSGDSGKALRLSGEFHFKIADIAANPPLATFARNLVSRISLIISQYSSPGSPQCALLDEHKALLSAMRAGDQDLAESLMQEHIQHIEDKINFNEEPTSISLREVFVQR